MDYSILIISICMGYFIRMKRVKTLSKFVFSEVTFVLRGTFFMFVER